MPFLMQQILRLKCRLYRHKYTFQISHHSRLHGFQIAFQGLPVAGIHLLGQLVVLSWISFQKVICLLISIDKAM